jgi:hypothetical protein
MVVVYFGGLFLVVWYGEDKKTAGFAMDVLNY